MRKVGGFEFASTAPEFTGYMVRADLAGPDRLNMGRNHTPGGMYIRCQPGYVEMVDFDGRRAACRRHVD